MNIANIERGFLRLTVIVSALVYIIAFASFWDDFYEARDDYHKVKLNQKSYQVELITKELRLPFTDLSKLSYLSSEYMRALDKNAKIRDMIKEADKFNDMDNFANNNNIKMTEKAIHELGFKNKDVMLKAVFIDTQWKKAVAQLRRYERAEEKYKTCKEDLIAAPIMCAMVIWGLWIIVPLYHIIKPIFVWIIKGFRG